MKRFCRTGATLVFGAGLGTAGSHLLRLSGVQDEEHQAGLLSRVPVVPVVQASELTVSMRARWRLIETGPVEEVPFGTFAFVRVT